MNPNDAMQLQKVIANSNLKLSDWRLSSSNIMTYPTVAEIIVYKI